MNKLFQKCPPSVILTLLALIAVGCAMTSDMGQKEIKVALSGDQEVPPVKTSATGSATFVIAADKTVTGKVTTSGVEATAAHIHEAAKGANGPVIVPLAKAADNSWSPAAGAKLTDAQYSSYLAGNLYVNVHSAANKAGEIRAQLPAVK
ncbi:MAG: CHRD domain-containing protein [Deltaproteobacteria bacterium]|nr:CHRD domain-containing protein [Deltaproteobacteria bacterium]